MSCGSRTGARQMAAVERLQRVRICIAPASMLSSGVRAVVLSIAGQCQQQLVAWQDSRNTGAAELSAALLTNRIRAADSASMMAQSQQ